ncbi:single-stranded DNA-binding protein [Jonesiaceae bacterium BS-20]|uniref:Single-stranded DNA-binding protein n=1 Tax=Jonesiaceae bacterium BS-20 TaxID=3120821 RepID=A0AAU7DX18_9MICO
MSLDASVTVNGWIGTQPRYNVSESGVELTTFRLGSTRRYFNRVTQQWVDGPTTWFTVKCWRGMAKNVADSLRKSDAVLVHGSLSVEIWEGPEGTRTSVVIDATALGPDLSRGMGSFRHAERRREPVGTKEQLPDVSGSAEVGDGQTAPEQDGQQNGAELNQINLGPGDFGPEYPQYSQELEDQEESLTMTDETETREPLNA